MKKRPTTSVEPHHQFAARVLIVALVFCVGVAVIIFVLDLQDKNERAKAMLQAHAHDDDAQSPAPTAANNDSNLDTNLFAPLPTLASTNTIAN